MSGFILQKQPDDLQLNKEMSLIGEENQNVPNLKENTVEEVQLRKRRDRNKQQSERENFKRRQKREQLKEYRKKTRFFTPEKLVKLNIKQRNDQKRFNRQAKRMRQNFIKVDTNEGLIAIVRIGSDSDASKKTKNILNSLRLSKLFSVVLARRTPELLRNLILVKPFIAWGVPNRKIVNELLTKHAHTMIDDKRVPVSDNVIVEDHLGDKNIICIADMENEIMTLGPAFDAVNMFLTPFELSSAFTRLEVGVLHKNHIEAGDQGDKINKIIERML